MTDGDELVYQDSNGYVWMVHFLDVTSLPVIIRQTVADWIDIDEIEVRPGTADDMWAPLLADDVEQLEARRDLIREGRIGSKYNLRIRSRRSLP